MKGTIDIDALTNDPTSKQLFEIFKTSKPEIQIMIIEEKMKDRYKSWNKRTATSPSGQYLGYYHALFRPFKYNNTTVKICIEEKREVIIQVHFMMRRITAINSHVYAQWKSILTCMIEKD